MQRIFSLLFSVVLILSVGSFAQEVTKALPSLNSSGSIGGHSSENSEDTGNAPATVNNPDLVLPNKDNTHAIGVRDKLGYYFTETYMNASTFTAPAFRAGIRMANPPGKGATQYPAEWRQGAEGFGRNYGDAFAERVSFQTARFVTGTIVREDPRYIPSGSHNPLARSLHAFRFSFVDQSDSGRPMPALSNLVGAAAGGFVGNAYLPSGFNNLTHAGQRVAFRFGMVGAGNLFREFAPQMPGPMRTFFQLIAR